MKNQNMMKNKTIGGYTFKRSVSIEDVAVAALIKFYLKEMEAEKPGMARIMLQELVRPSTATSRSRSTSTNTSRGADKVIATIDCAKLAQVIDAARTQAIHSSFISTEGGEAREAINPEGDPLLERTLSYIDGDLLQELSGSDYVTRMPIELADMVMECYEWFVKENGLEG